MLVKILDISVFDAYEDTKHLLVGQVVEVSDKWRESLAKEKPEHFEDASGKFRFTGDFYLSRAKMSLMFILKWRIDDIRFRWTSDLSNGLRGFALDFTVEKV